MEVTNPARSGQSSPTGDRVSEAYSWASQLASESRDINWVARWYVWPDAVLRLLEQLDNIEGALVCLVGRQGVGKSSALQAIYASRITAQRERLNKAVTITDTDLDEDSVLIKWRREPELFKALLDDTHELSFRFGIEYREVLWKRIYDNRSMTEDEKHELLGSGTRDLKLARLKLGKTAAEAVLRSAWLRTLRRSKTILVDTPDYSKTDRRLMAKDLDEVYWLWNHLSKSLGLGENVKPNLVVAIQKEMFRDHFFFDKMGKIELEPLRPDQMVQAYVNRFGSTAPFTEDGLLTVARMSRGIFRRFLRYISLALDLWESIPEPGTAISPEIVKRAITAERLAEDMELELAELFPKHSDLRLQAIQLLMHLEESGPTKQSKLAEELGLERYAMSRLLTKLELHRYVTRERAATDKTVSLANVG